MNTQKQSNKAIICLLILLLGITVYLQAYAITDNGKESSCKGTTTIYSITINLKSGQSSVIEYGLVGNGDATFNFMDNTSLTQSEFIAKYLTTPVDIQSHLGAIYGGQANDCLQATGTENTSLFGGPGNDKLVGNASKNTLSGGSGDDAMFGGDGDDTMLGGSGDDTMLGGKGNDTFIGESNANFISDEAGDDKYEINDDSALNVISDRGGKGKIYLNNSPKSLSGGTLLKDNDNYWISDDELVGYTFSVDQEGVKMLIIESRVNPEQTIQLDGWKDGDLRIRLKSFWCKIWSGFCAIE
jgi:Ca2+-binding RTX toxin-like protein